jgi:putative ABC transport system permease protein
MVISPMVIILSSILGFFTVFISAMGPANQAAKVPPIEAVKNSGSTKVEKVKNVKKSLFIKYIFGIEGQFANRNIRRNNKRFRITAFSMIISIVLYIVTAGIMGYAFKTGVADSGKGYTYMLFNTGASKNIDKSVLKDITSLNSVEKIYPLYNDSPTVLLPMDKINPQYYKLTKGHFAVKIGNSFRVNGCNLASYGYQGLDDMKKNIKSGTADKDVLNKENGVVLINTSKLYIEKGKSTVLDVTNYKVGDEIELSPESTTWGKFKHKKVKVVGIADKACLSYKYNENFGVIMLTTPEVYKNITGNDNITSVFIMAKPGVSHTEITDYLNRLEKNNSAYNYLDNEKAAKENKDSGTIISILLYGFIFVILLIGCLNISNTISTNLILRTKEFAVLKAVGMTQQAVNKMILLEGVLYGLMSALYGTVIGTIIYYIVFKALSGIEEITWAIPWQNILIAAAGSVLITLIWSLIPMRKINSKTITDDLRTDN